MPPSSNPVPTPHRVPAPPSRLVAEVAGAPALAASGPVLVGFSGGGDSLALLHLLRQAAPTRTVIAAIVDHRFRTESASEASDAAGMARALGVLPTILTLDWPGDWRVGERRSQDAARLARHRALARLAAQIGARVLFLGHTCDDQAETVLMRRDAGSGPRGLAGMAALSPSPVWPEGRDLWIGRPVLGVSREELRAYLRAAGLRWIEDPSNTMRRFARVRARATLRESGETERLVEAAAHCATEAAGDDRRALGLIDAHVRFAEGGATFDPALLVAAGAARAVAALALGVGGAAREPGPQAVERLRTRLEAGETATLSGARFFMNADRVCVARDPGGVHGRRGGGAALAALSLPEHETVFWDNRLALTARKAGMTAVPAADRRVDGPDISADAPVDRRWLVEHRVRRLLWRDVSPVFE